jgi:eukaryotic-like serine/threonine-protein kinase
METVFGRESVVARVAPPAEGAGGGGEPAAGAEFAARDEKYESVAPIGSGGMGEVLLVRDRDLRREVAMKLLREDLAANEAMRRSFVAEAQATSQLEHPGIPPVHDIGTTPDGKIYFTMKIVRGRTLGAILKDLVLGGKDVRQEFTLHRLATVLERIAEAVHFAHEKGVIHRDLKPANVMLGEFGEVHVMDWGIAKVKGATDTGDDDSGFAAVRTAESDAGPQTTAGTIKGTIPYMSPEQARGDAIDRRSDVWALGAILYEILTLQPAFDGHGFQLVSRVQKGEFPDVAARNPRRAVPEALAQLCRRSMALDPAGRPATAREFAGALRAFLDGRAERERRHREAEALAAQGRAAMALYSASRTAVAAAERAAEEMSATFRPWQSVDEKAGLLDARDGAARARRSVVLAFAETTRLLEAAIVAESDNASARALLSDLWRLRLDDAERRADAADADFAQTMVRRYDDGRLAAYVQGDGTLDLSSDPEGAEVVLSRFEDARGVLSLGEARPFGRTPLVRIPLPMGSYLCTISFPGCRDVRYPVHITRNRAWTGRVRMRMERDVGEGMVAIPAGPFLFGEGKDARIVELPDFAIAARPVTLGEWAEFLAAVEREEGRDAAAKLCPGTPGDGPVLERGADGAWKPREGLVTGAAVGALLERHGPGFELRWPVFGISWHDAAAWCEWRSRATGKAWRLPTEEEREKAARGVDGRVFPWGGLEDPSLLKCVDSRPEPSQPEPVGSFPAAASVYGMLDAAGGTWDWTSSYFSGAGGGTSAPRVARGGSWFNPIANARCAYRARIAPDVRNAFLGFRPARTL